MKHTVKTLLIAAALFALSTPALAHPPHGGHHPPRAAYPGAGWAPAHAPRHGKHHRRHGHHGYRHPAPRYGGHRHGPRCGHPHGGAYYGQRHPTYGAYGAALTLRLDDVWLSVHGHR